LVVGPPAGRRSRCNRPPYSELKQDVADYSFPVDTPTRGNPQAQAEA